MEKIKEDAIKAIVAIIIGIEAIVSLNEFWGGILLIAIGFVVIGVNENLRNLFLSFIKWLLDIMTRKEHVQTMENSPEGIQQHMTASGDIYNAKGDMIFGNKRRDSFKAGKNIYRAEKMTFIDKQAEKGQKAVLKMYYDKKETYHNVPIANITPVKNGLFLHTMVKNEKNILGKNCYGELVEVQEYRNGVFSKVPTFTAPVILKWAHEDFGKKLDIDKDVPRRLDVCHTIDGFDYFLFMTAGGPRGIQTQFPKGKYKIKVRVKGDNTDFSYGEYLIDFDGTWNKIKIDNA